MRTRIMGIAVILAALALTLTACGADESREDANDVHNGLVEKSAPAVIAFNNHYPNVEAKCDGFGDLLLVVSHDDQKSPAITVLPGHPYCTGAGKSYNDMLRTNEQPSRSVDPPTNPAVYPASASVTP